MIKTAGRILLPVLARLSITGRDHLPQKGPLILAGNHEAYLEVALMVIFPPYQVELIGAGDIPVDPAFAPLANLYGFIPINRGNLDRAGLHQALSVLKQNGVVGIFPEGGIWQPNQMNVQIGVSWLSSQANAPVVPIGFGGMRGALHKMLQLRRPALTMNIGAPIPPVQKIHHGVSRKEALASSARLIMDHIQALIPRDERVQHQSHRNGQYELEIILIHDAGDTNGLPKHKLISHHEQLAHFLMQPVLLDVFVRNLKLAAVKPLQNLNQPLSAAALRNAVRAILDYLDVNQGFLTYRFGVDAGLAMRAGLAELYDLAAWAADQGFQLYMTPVYRYSDPEGNAVIEKGSRLLEKR